MAKLRKKMKYNCKSGLQLFERKVLLLTKDSKRQEVMNMQMTKMC